MDIQRDIQRLDDGIRRLKIQYDQFFAGSLARQPFELRAEMEQIIRRCSNASIQKLTHRFHFNTLVSRYNSFLSLWEKHIRAMEEGRSLPGAPAAPPAEEQEPGEGTSARNERNDRIVHQMIVQGHEGERPDLRGFYDKYLVVCRALGQSAPRIAFDVFSRQLLRQAEAVKNRAECDAVRLRLSTHGDRVLLKAVPVQRRRS